MKAEDGERLWILGYDLSFHLNELEGMMNPVIAWASEKRVCICYSYSPLEKMSDLKVIYVDIQITYSYLFILISLDVGATEHPEEEQ